MFNVGQVDVGSDALYFLVGLQFRRQTAQAGRFNNVGRQFDIATAVIVLFVVDRVCLDVRRLLARDQQFRVCVDTF